jgi:acyl carrier protein
MISERLEHVLREHLVLLPPGEGIPRESKLTELGLDSMAAISVLLELEQAFEVTFPDSMLNGDTFRSAATLEDAIRKLLDGDASPADGY